MPQDMPPTSGYEPVQYRRNLPARGFRPAFYLAAVGGIVTYGFWRYGQGMREMKYVSIIQHRDSIRGTGPKEADVFL